MVATDGNSRTCVACALGTLNDGLSVAFATGSIMGFMVEEKFPQENFRVFSEMRFLGKIRVAILDFVGYVEILMKFGAKLNFRG